MTTEAKAAADADYESPTSSPFDLVRKATNKSTDTESTKESDLSENQDRTTLSAPVFTPQPMTGIAITHEINEEEIADDTTGSSETDKDETLDYFAESNVSKTKRGEENEEKRMDRTDDVVTKAMSGGLAAAAGLKDRDAKMIEEKKKSRKLSLIFSKKEVVDAKKEEEQEEEKAKYKIQEGESEEEKDSKYHEPKEKSSTFVAWQSPFESKFSHGAALDETIETISMYEVTGPVAEEKGLDTLRALEIKPEQIPTKEKEPEVIQVHQLNDDDDDDVVVPPASSTQQSYRPATCFASVQSSVPLCGAAVSGLMTSLPFFKEEQSNVNVPSSRAPEIVVEATTGDGEEKPTTVPTDENDDLQDKDDNMKDDQNINEELEERAKESDEGESVPEPTSSTDSTEGHIDDTTDAPDPSTDLTEEKDGNESVEKAASVSEEEPVPAEKEVLAEKPAVDRLAFETMSYRELRDLCKECGLDAKGSKAVFVERLEEHYDDGQYSV